MKKIELVKPDFDIPFIAVGCIRMSTLDIAQANVFINESLDLGANFFDNAK